MLDNEMLIKIESGEISSRRKLYKIVGRSRKLLQWLNDNNILIPSKWTREMLHRELLNLRDSSSSLLANDNRNLCRVALRFYPTWNDCLLNVVGYARNRRYTAQEIEQAIPNYVKKYKQLPLREEFDGSSPKRPYFESVVNHYKVKNWTEVLGVVDLTNIKYYECRRLGRGKVYRWNGFIFLSRQEFLIGRYLHGKNIRFEKEVPYGNCSSVFDFYLPDFGVYIEYYGMETEEYKQRIKNKRKYYSGRKVIEIFKHDNTLAKLSLEVQRL